jgi:multidrug transporter EmrE-like cation transporter
LIWLWVLAKVDVGLAYPLVGLGLVVTYFAGVIVFGEPFSWLRIFACLLIVLGIGLLATQYKS